LAARSRRHIHRPAAPVPSPVPDSAAPSRPTAPPTAAGAVSAAPPQRDRRAACDPACPRPHLPAAGSTARTARIAVLLSPTPQSGPPSGTAIAPPAARDRERSARFPPPLPPLLGAPQTHSTATRS